MTVSYLTRTVHICRIKSRQKAHGCWWEIYPDEVGGFPIYLFDASIRRKLEPGQTVTFRLKHDTRYFGYIIEKIERENDERSTDNGTKTESSGETRDGAAGHSSRG